MLQQHVLRQTWIRHKRLLLVMMVQLVMWPAKQQ
jgi:hypothetical protein